MIFIPNRKVGIPDYSSVSREGKTLDLLIYATHTQTLKYDTQTLKYVK